MEPLIAFSILLIVILVVFYYHLVRKYYVQRSIYELRQSKHDVIMFLSEHAVDIEEGDYIELKKLLTVINQTIELFTKLNGMRFSVVKTIMVNTVSSSLKLDSTFAPVVKKHESLLKHYIIGIHMSIKAIPLFKLRIIIHAVRLLLKFLIYLGIDKGKNYLRQFERFVTAENERFNNHCVN